MNRHLKRALLRWTLPQPARARHAEYSMILSTDDQGGQPTPRLVDLAIQSVTVARDLRLDGLLARTRGCVDLINHWPGEQHRLLAALVQVAAPRRIVEIGTGAGEPPWR